jgi:hypothetical protein
MATPTTSTTLGLSRFTGVASSNIRFSAERLFVFENDGDDMGAPRFSPYLPKI